MALSARIIRLKHAVQTEKPGVCPQRALIYTDYFKKRKNGKKPVSVQMAEALGEVLLNKSKTIYPDELIVGDAKHIYEKGENILDKAPMKDVKKKL